MIKIMLLLAFTKPNLAKACNWLCHQNVHTSSKQKMTSRYSFVDGRAYLTSINLCVLCLREPFRKAITQNAGQFACKCGKMSNIVYKLISHKSFVGTLETRLRAIQKIRKAQILNLIDQQACKKVLNWISSTSKSAAH